VLSIPCIVRLPSPPPITRLLSIIYLQILIPHNSILQRRVLHKISLSVFLSPITNQLNKWIIPSGKKAGRKCRAKFPHCRSKVRIYITSLLADHSGGDARFVNTSAFGTEPATADIFRGAAIRKRAYSHRENSAHLPRARGLVCKSKGTAFPHFLCSSQKGT
jgi:hypothetical protein